MKNRKTALWPKKRKRSADHFQHRNVIIVSYSPLKQKLYSLIFTGTIRLDASVFMMKYCRERMKNKYPAAKYLKYAKNKYILTLLGFVVWLSFFDRNDFLTTWTYHQKLVSLRTEKQYYDDEIKRYTEDLNNLVTNHKTMEKYAREKYYMKKDNEEVFLIIKEESKD
jgi:cell division protein FtsB